MIMHHVLRFVLVICALLVGTPGAKGVVQLAGVNFTRTSGISMTITGFYDNLPRSGFAPIRITIRNDSSSAHQWTFRFVSQAGYRSSVRNEYAWGASVEGRSEEAFDVLVPLVTVGDAPHIYPSLELTVSGYGVESSKAYYAANHKYTGSTHAPFTGISSTLAVGSLGPLEQELTDRRLEFTGCRLDLAYLSSDWRAYLGFATVWLTEQDWRQVGSAARAGILDWVYQGGQLMLCSRNSANPVSLERLGLPRGPLSLRPLGLGRVRIIDWNGSELDPAVAAVEILRDESLAHARQLDHGYSGTWSLRSLIPDTRLNSPLIILAMIGFAVVVGPVNLVVFAGKRRRHRLFLTTPVISILASLSLVLIILIQDGIGGEGGRVALKYLMPATHRELMIQEQISRTGVLLASRFDLSTTDYIASINLDHSQDKRHTRNLVRTDATAEGDWFSSRSVQAQYLSRIVPSRARVEWLNAAAVQAGEQAPVLLSSLDQPLVDVMFVDDRNRFWSAPALKVGVRTPMVESSRSQFRREWWEKHVGDAGLRAGGLTDRLAFRTGHVFGVAESPERTMIETHGGIRWDRDHLVVMGPALDAEQGL